MIVENAPSARRGFVGSFQQVGFALGTLAGTSCSFAITAGMSGDAVSAWGWRIPFAAGLLLAPITLYIRRNVGETEDFRNAVEAAATTARPVRVVFRTHKRIILAVIGVGVLGTAAGYLGNQFLTSFAGTQLGLRHGTVSGIIVLGAAVQTLLIPLWGALSDRIGRFPVIGGAAVIYGIVIFPMFRLLVNSPSTSTLTTVVVVSSVLVAASFGPLPAAISELFPTQVRATGLSIGYNIAVALFGGFAPYIATALVRVTGSNTSPTYYGLLCAAITAATCATLLVGRRSHALTQTHAMAGAQ
jgi:MHS family proline/betaine transporter-like MFS transporter